MLRTSKKRKVKIPRIKIEARMPLLVFANMKEKRKKDEPNIIINKKITG